MNENSALTQVVKELQSSNLSQELILDTIDNYNFTLASDSAHENTIDVPIFLEKLVSVAFDLNRKFDVLIRSNIVLAKRLDRSVSNFNNSRSTNTQNNTSNFNNTKAGDLALPNLQTFTKGLLLKAIPSPVIGAYIGGIQKLFDEVSKLRLDEAAIERIIKPLSMLSTSLESITNISLTKAMVGLVKFKIFNKALNAFFKNASSPENLQASTNLKTVSDNLAPLETIGKSLTAFANVKWIKTLLSAKTFKMFLGSLSKLPLAIVEKMTAVVKKIGEGLPKPLKKISDAIGDFGEKIGKIGGALIKGAIGILALSASLIPLSIGLKMFKGIDLKTIGVAGAALAGLSAIGVLLGKNMGATLKGALAIAALGASLIPLAFSLRLFSGINWNDINYAATTLGALALAAGIIGAPGVNAAVAIGAGVIALLGASLIPLAYSLERLSALDIGVLGEAGIGIANFGLNMLKGAPGLALGGLAMIPLAAGVLALGGATALVGDSLSGFMEKFTNFSNALDPAKLFSTAEAILALSGSIAAFGAAQVGEGLGNFVGKLLRFGSDSPLEQLQKFADIGENLKSAGLGVLNLSEGISKLSKLGDEIKALKEFPLDTIGKLSDIFAKNQILTSEATVQSNITSTAPKTGESLNAIGNISNVSPTVVVNNNNGGNVNNVSTSNVNNNSSPMMPILTGSAMGY